MAWLSLALAVGNKLPARIELSLARLKLEGFAKRFEVLVRFLRRCWVERGSRIFLLTIFLIDEWCSESTPEPRRFSPLEVPPGPPPLRSSSWRLNERTIRSKSCSTISTSGSSISPAHQALHCSKCTRLGVPPLNLLRLGLVGEGGERGTGRSKKRCTKCSMIARF